MEGQGTAILINAKFRESKTFKEGHAKASKKDDYNRCNFQAVKLIGEPGSPCKRRVYRKE